MSTPCQYDMRDYDNEGEVESEVNVEVSPERVIELRREMRDALRAANDYREKLDVIRDENDVYFEKCQSLKKTMEEKRTELSQLRDELSESKAQADLSIREQKEIGKRIVFRLLTGFQEKKKGELVRRVAEKWKRFVHKRKQDRYRSCRILMLVLSRELRSDFYQTLHGSKKPVLSLTQEKCLEAPPKIVGSISTETEEKRPILRLATFPEIAIDVKLNRDVYTLISEEKERIPKCEMCWFSAFSRSPAKVSDIELQASPLIQTTSSQSDELDLPSIQFLACLRALRGSRRQARKARFLLRVLWGRLKKVYA